MRAKRKALQQVAGQGWTDIAAGHPADMADPGLEDFICQLGLRAARKQMAER